MITTIVVVIVLAVAVLLTYSYFSGGREGSESRQTPSVRALGSGEVSIKFRDGGYSYDCARCGPADQIWIDEDRALAGWRVHMLRIHRRTEYI